MRQTRWLLPEDLAAGRDCHILMFDAAVLVEVVILAGEL
jgi:hypothetical protein